MYLQQQLESALCLCVCVCVVVLQILAAIYQTTVAEGDGRCVHAPNLSLPLHQEWAVMKMCQNKRGKKIAETHPSPPYYHNEENTLSGP